jgi:hypothetical protein
MLAWFNKRASLEKKIGSWSTSFHLKAEPMLGSHTGILAARLQEPHFALPFSLFNNLGNLLSLEANLNATS